MNNDRPYPRPDPNRIYRASPRQPAEVTVIHPDFLTLQSLANLLDYRTPKSVRHWAEREGIELQKCGGRTGLYRRRYERWLTWKQSS